MDSTSQNARVYHINVWQRAGALFILSLGLAYAAVIWGRAIFGDSEPSLRMILLNAAFVLVGVSLVTFAFKSTVTLFHDAIEVQTLFSRKRLPYSGIRGRREYIASDSEGGNTPYLKLVPNDDTLPTLDFQKAYMFDDAFYQWFNSLPDLDRPDKERDGMSRACKTSDFGLV